VTGGSDAGGSLGESDADTPGPGDDEALLLGDPLGCSDGDGLGPVDTLDDGLALGLLLALGDDDGLDEALLLGPGDPLGDAHGWHGPGEWWYPPSWWCQRGQSSPRCCSHMYVWSPITTVACTAAW
jgi:hypothetical protein